MADLRERMIAEVQPTPEQIAAIDRILAEARPAREPGLSDEERRAAMRQARQDLQRRIAGALDPERRARFEAMMSERRGGRGPAAAEAGTPARVYVLDPAGVPQPIAVRVGITDGSTTELVSGDLAEGTALVIGGGPRNTSGPGPDSSNSPASRPRPPRLF